MTWFKRFHDPITLDDGRELLTLHDAASYIMALPKSESDLPDWQIATQALLMTAEGDGPDMLARIAMMKALGRGKPPPTPEPRAKVVRKFRVVR